jgi:O-antigen/teichoic acid export membrane protein
MPNNWLRSLPAIKSAHLRSMFLRNVISTFLVSVLLLFLSIATSAVIARWLGPEGKGTLTLVLLAPAVLGIVLSGGVGIANVYHAGSRRLAVPQLTSNSVAFALLAAAAGIALVVGGLVTGWLTRLLPGVPVDIATLAALAFPVALLTGYFAAILQGLQRIISVNFINLVQGVLMLALTVLLVVVWQLGLLGGLLAHVGTGVLILLLTAALLRQEGANFAPSWKSSIMRPTLSFGLRGYVGNLLQFFNYRLDAFIVNYFLGPAGVGIYSVSVALAELLWRLPNAVSFVIFPKATVTRPEVMNTFTPRVFGATLALTALGGVGLALTGRFFIQTLYTSAFDAAYGPLLALLPGAVLLGGAKVLINEIAGRGYPHYNSISAGLALVLTVILDLVLIPRHGVLGAAIASSVAYTAIFVAAVGFYLSVSRRQVTRAV